MPDTVKTDPKEHAQRKKWQDEVSAQLGADAISSGMFVNQMKDSFDKQSQFWSNSVRIGDMSNTLLQSVEANTFRTADLFAEYLDFIKDAERKRLEAAMEAARLAKDKDKDKGGGDKALGDMEFSWGGLAAGIVGAVGAAALLFKESLVDFFTGNKIKGILDDMKLHRIAFFNKVKILSKKFNR